MDTVVSVNNVSKIYDSGFQALKSINLDINKGEILALLGPNGAGKTTLISIICGIVNKTSGSVTVDGFDTINDYKKTRQCIGLVPQELTTDSFESVWSTIRFSRGLYGCKPDDAYLEKILKDLSLWDKKDNMIMTLSGGMKRRVLIAKALSHEPTILFLDEPTAGVDVELRQDMWKMISQLRSQGVTVVLTTHYIEEAEMMADRIGVINKGEIVVLKQKTELLQELGQKQLILTLTKSLEEIPTSLHHYDIHLSEDKQQLIHTFNTLNKMNISVFMEDLNNCGITFSDLSTEQSSLEEIFVQLVKESK